MKKTLIPEDHSIESIKVREQIIRDFYREWKEKNPSQRKYNLSLKEYINIRMVSIIETSEHAAKNYLSTIAVLQLDAILMGAKKISVNSTKQGNKNQKPFEKMIVMEYDVAFVGKVRMTVALILPQQRGGGLHFHVMLCGRGLGTTHIHRPLTTYVLGAKLRTIIEIHKHFGLFF